MTEASVAASEPARRRFVAPAILTGILQTVAYGTFYYAFAVLKQPMAESGIDTRVLLIGLSAAFLIGGLCAPRVGRAIDAFDGRKVMALGTFAGGLACAAFSVSDRPVFLCIACGLLGVAFAASLYDAAFSTMVRVAPRDGRNSIIIITLIAGFASTLFWPITHWLESRYGWRSTWQLYALVNCCIATPAYAFLLPAPRKLPTHASDTEEQPLSMESASGRRAFVLLAVLFSGAALVGATLSIHVIDILRRAGLDDGAAVGAASLIGAAQVAGRLVQFLLTRQISMMATAVFVVTCFPLSLLILAGTGSFRAALLFAAVYGLANGLLTIVRGALPLQFFGSRGYGHLMGRLAVPSLIAESVAPAVSGIVFVALGDTISILLLLGLAATSFTATLLLFLERSKPVAEMP
ncbi:MAG: MFS transporter [Pseudomonadota bacterium]|nr:MFS transporter [Pseudomonadota bacterium]